MSQTNIEPEDSLDIKVDLHAPNAHHKSIAPFTIHPEEVGTSKALRCPINGVKVLWAAVAREERVPNELRKLVLADLMEMWHFDRVNDFHFHARLEDWGGCDTGRLVLEDEIGSLGSSGWGVRHLFNKLTAFYVLQAAQNSTCTGQLFFIPGQIYSATFQEWIRCYDMKPTVDWGHFMANPVRVTPTGPSTVRGIVAAHRSLYTQASSLVKGAKDDGKPISGLRGGFLESHSLFPLYQAIVIIFDTRWDPPEDEIFGPDGFVSLQKFALNQTVLIARTGWETGLSAPVSFATLETQPLPEGIGGADTTDADVIRVSLATAIPFIFDLEQRENLAHPKSHEVTLHDPYLDPIPPEGYTKDDPVSHEPETWADASLKAAQKYGLENVPRTYESLCRVRAVLIGEDHEKLEHLPHVNCYRY
ncbi:MAG: hypothetical protein Q9220_006184 [cf. Caloplaca sp. 1 TL-2023]